LVNGAAASCAALEWKTTGGEPQKNDMSNASGSEKSLGLKLEESRCRLVSPARPFGYGCSVASVLVLLRPDIGFPRRKSRSMVRESSLTQR